MFKHLKTVHNFISHLKISTRPAHKNVNVNPIKKILIANRGEIACRVIRTAKRLGIRSVAVYSDADKNSLHTLMADEAYRVGPAASSESYLKSSVILDIAKQTKCQGIHPGYGFLSENYEFSEQCQREGVIFIGPPGSAIRDMGIKSTSKSIMAAAGVPIINGYHGEDQSDEKLIAEADKIGFPLMIKAIRGGGGKGMRIAESKEKFLEALNSARTESEKSFGDSSVLLERYVRSPRHVEVQVFADQYGDAVYLFERDCSVQRRHQKIIEEAPAPGLSEELRRNLGEAGVRAAKAVGYVGAGTVEFILDKVDHSFHFMEMNTRLQVEHPITEMITKTDLVEWQIRIASGEPLPLTQEQIVRNGHAFEARIYAENPRNGFLPGAGVLRHLSTPKPEENVRIETGVRQGDEVSVHYDPMIAKLVVWGKDRTHALDLLIAKLGEYQIAGLDTNVNFLIDLASHAQFRAGDVHTGFIDEHFNSLFPPIEVTEELAIKAAATLFLNEDNAIRKNSILESETKSDPFLSAKRFRVNHDFVREYFLELNGNMFKVELKSNSDEYQMRMNGGAWRKVNVLLVYCGKKCTIQLDIDDNISIFSAALYNGNLDVFVDKGRFSFNIRQPKFLTSNEELSGGGSENSVASPMPGVLEKLLVEPGDFVKKGDNLAIIIAMKMEHVLKAPRDGVVKSVSAKQGDNVLKGKPIIKLDLDE
ncbi:methylcrotonoyl-CoA carboxylase subunit alpha, mitochondrial [Eupeodes corollae]|uniref:methylcrotonoyl-CoA carboxylase subunit alpha, mitochondrial n=1 Tax=Eupeodes corollae TaxID=290404 RepID=UPI00248FDD65|nr:methylcrotonoyl-CoA carboxylase subunit alpha, mitochondrial [Eupeodes corollae]